MCVCVKGKKSFISFKNIPIQTIKYLRANSSANYFISDLIWRTRAHSCDWENTQMLHRVKYAKNFGGDWNRSSFILPIRRATVDRKASRSHSKETTGAAHRMRSSSRIRRQEDESRVTKLNATVDFKGGVKEECYKEMFITKDEGSVLLCVAKS